jgi:hypothetical protein
MSRTSSGASPPARAPGEALPETATDWAERRKKAAHLLALGALRHARRRAAAAESDPPSPKDANLRPNHVREVM